MLFFLFNKVIVIIGGGCGFGIILVKVVFEVCGYVVCFDILFEFVVVEWVML